MLKQLMLLFILVLILEPYALAQEPVVSEVTPLSHKRGRIVNLLQTQPDDLNSLLTSCVALRPLVVIAKPKAFPQLVR